MEKQIIEDLKYIRRKLFRNIVGWEKVLDFLIDYGRHSENPTNDKISSLLTKEDEDRIYRLCSFMADMIAKYGKAETLEQINEAIRR